ncbi:MAG: luciferase family protein, partial [Acidimicrobiales bacterium]
MGESMFSEGPALWVNGKEIAHWDADGVIDVRLTRAIIRQRREHLRTEPWVWLRRSSSSDWMEVSVGVDRDDSALLVELIREAALVHRAPAGQ